MMFRSITSYVMSGLMVTILILLGVGYWYFTYSQQQMGQLREHAAQLEQAVQTQQHTIHTYQQAQARTNQEVLALQQRLNRAESTRRDLELRLRRQNLEAEARVRRQDTERIMNMTLQEQMRAFEQLSAPASVNVNTGSQVANTDAHTQPQPRPPVRRSSP
jgi:biopolymer transport protein ExbB/TolQ